MSKLELALVIVVVAVATAWWSQNPKETAPPQIPARTSTPGSLPATPLPFLTRSGRYEILAPPYSLAGVPIGADEKAVTAALGKPDSESEKEKETHSWIYERDGQRLTVTFLENLVISVGGSGRWQFDGPGQPGGTLFMQTEKTIFEKLGQPTRTDKNTAIYNSKPGELTIHFSSSGTVEQFWLTGEVKPLAVK